MQHVGAGGRRRGSETVELQGVAGVQVRLLAGLRLYVGIELKNGQNGVVNFLSTIPALGSLHSIEPGPQT